MDHNSYSDDYLRDILSGHRTFAVVGASANPTRPSFAVASYLLAHGFNVIPINPGHAGREILGQRVYGCLSDIPGPVEVVDVFRKSEAVPDVVRNAIAIGAKVVWMQLGVHHAEAAQAAEAAGLRVVMNRCPKIEYERLGLGLAQE